MSTKYKFHDQDQLYFVSFAVVNWIDLFIRNEYKDIMISSWKHCQQYKGLEIYGYCIMTSHIHPETGTPAMGDISQALATGKAMISGQGVAVYIGNDNSVSYQTGTTNSYIVTQSQNDVWHFNTIGANQGGNEPGIRPSDSWFLHHGWESAPWYGNFLGPGPDRDPYKLIGPDGHYLKPIDMLDAAAQRHDYRYNLAHTGGVSGALFATRVFGADKELAPYSSASVQRGAVRLCTRAPIMGNDPTGNLRRPIDNTSYPMGYTGIPDVARNPMISIPMEEEDSDDIYYSTYGSGPGLYGSDMAAFLAYYRETDGTLGGDFIYRASDLENVPAVGNLTQAMGAIRALSGAGGLDAIHGDVYVFADGSVESSPGNSNTVSFQASGDKDNWTLYELTANQGGSGPYVIQNGQKVYLSDITQGTTSYIGSSQTVVVNNFSKKGQLYNYLNNLEGEYNNGSLELGAIATLAPLPFAKYIEPVPGAVLAIGGLGLSTELAFTGSSIEDVKDGLGKNATAIIITTTINSGANGTAFSSTTTDFYHPNGTLFLTMSYSNHQ